MYREEKTKSKMKKKISKSVFAAAAIAAVGLGSYKTYQSYMSNNILDAETLFAENVDAQAYDPISDLWNTFKEWYDKPVYKKVKKSCTVTENSGSFSFGFDFGINGSVNSPSTSITYPGHYYSCEDGSELAHCSSTSCVKD